MKFKQMQDIAGCRVWGAYAGNFQFIIAYQKDIGYSASWKHKAELNKPANRIDDDENYYQTMAQAEAACKAQLRQLNQ